MMQSFPCLRHMPIVLLCLCCCSIAEAQSLNFQKAIGGPGVDYARDLRVVPGGFIMLGTTNGYGAGRSDIYLVRTDTAGRILWTHTYGTALEDFAAALVITNDGGFAIAGYSTDTSGTHITLTRTDSAGNVLWSHSYKRSRNDMALCLESANDGGFLIGGCTQIAAPFNNDAYLLNVDSAGLIRWTKTFGEVDDDGVGQIVATSGGRFIVSGWLYSAASLRQGFYIMQLDSTGATLWTHAYAGDSSYISTAGMSCDGSGNIFIAGSTFMQNGAAGLCLLKANNLGTMQWAKAYTARGHDIGYGLCPAQGGFILCGDAADPNQVARDGLLINVDASGDLIQSIAYGGSGSDVAACIRPVPGRGYVVAGSTTSFGHTRDDCYLVQTNAGLQQSCAQQEPVIVSQLITTPIVASFNYGSGGTIGTGITASGSGGNGDSVCNQGLVIPVPMGREGVPQFFPNPSDGSFNILTPGQGYFLQVFNSLGQIIYSVLLPAGHSTINLKRYAPGIYAYTLRNNTGLPQRGKLEIR